MKKVLFINFNCYWNPHFETELELMHQHQLDGNEVYSLHCEGELMHSCASAMFNPNKKKFCKRCQKRYKLGCKLINLPKKRRFKLETPVKYPDYVHADYQTMEEVKAINYDGINIGFSMFENIMLVNRAEGLDIKKIAIELDTALKISYIVYSNFKKICNQIKPDEIYVFNGKHQEYEPILSYCEAHRIDYFFHDRGANKNKYILVKNKRWHDLNTSIDLFINKYGRKYSGSKEDIKISTNWFEQRKKGFDDQWISFTNKQKQALLPNNFNLSCKNVTFFNSSLWEVINYDSWKPEGDFIDEIEILEKVCNNFKNNVNMHFYLRIHPHLGWEPTEQLKKLLEFKKTCPDNLTVIDPDDKIDTYELIQKSDIVVVPFGSTVGVESCYWGTPTILLNKALYQNIDVCYRPKSMNEFLLLLSQDDLPPKPKDNSYIYGYAWSIFGNTFKYYEAKDLFEGMFLGINLKNEIKLKNKIKKFLGLYNTMK